MAKYTLKDAIDDFGVFPYYYDSATLSLNKGASSTSATLADQYGFTVTFTGKNLTYADGAVTGGTVTAVTFSSPEEVLMTVTGGSFAAAKVIVSDLESALTTLYKGNDTFLGTGGDDVIGSGLNGGNDQIYGKAGDDYIVGSSGNNTVDGGTGRDTLNYDWAYNDKKHVVGGVNLDATKGTAVNPWGGTDTIVNIEVFYASYRNDVLKGSGRNEEFDGAEGNDRMTGGKGADTFLFHGGNGHDTISDFGNGADTVRLTGLIKGPMDEYDTFAEIQSIMTASKGNVVLDFGNGDVLTFVGITKADLTEADFDFFV